MVSGPHFLHLWEASNLYRIMQAERNTNLLGVVVQSLNSYYYCFLVSDASKCVGSWILHVQVFPIICILIFTMLSKITSFPGVGSFLFGRVERLEKCMDNAVPQCWPFPELWCVQDCAGNFPACAWALATIYSRRMEVNIWNTAMPIAYFPVELSTSKI